MTATPDAQGAPRPDDPDTIQPLAGEAGIPSVAKRSSTPMSKKGLLAVALLIVSLVVAASLSIARFAEGSKKPEDSESRLAVNRPAAATAAPRRLEMPAVGSTAGGAASAPAPRVPAPDPDAEGPAEPIGVRRTGASPPTSALTKAAPPEDAPVLLVSTRQSASPPSSARAKPYAAPRGASTEEMAVTNRELAGADPLDQTRQNLDAYQRQLQGLLDNLTRSTDAAIVAPNAGPPPVSSPLLVAPPHGGPSLAAAPTAGSGLFGGQLQGSATPKVAASVLGNRSLTLPKGTAFTCALKTRVISATSGLVGCQVQRNVYSDDGRVLLIERGSHLDGEYRIASVRKGTVRIPVLWTRIRTPHGVTVDIDSPGTGPLGESGIDGHVDNRWGERIGAALLLSLIDDTVKLVIQNRANDTQAETVVLQSTADTTSKLAEKVLDSTINIPPLIYQNQGGIVGIYVARDVDFSSVYELKPTALASPREEMR